MRCVLVLVIAAIAGVSTLGLDVDLKKILFQKHRPQPPEIDSPTSRLLLEQWIEQKLDHFDDTNLETWNMRYYSNSEYHVRGGPIFIMVGGDESVIPFWTINGHMHDMAKELNGILFVVEHRYYGKSQPMTDTTAQSLRFLNSEQALEDLKHFIEVQKSTLPNSQNAPVILVGTAYGATIATWFKQRHPELVAGVWASSPLLLAQADFGEFFVSAANAIKKAGGEDCHDRIERAFAQMETEINAGSAESIIEKFNLCALSPTSMLDVGAFFSTVAGFFTVMVALNSNGLLEGVCTAVNDPFIEDDVEAIAWFFQGPPTQCLDIAFSTLIEPLLDTTLSPDDQQNLRQGLYQSCNEFGWYHTSTSDEQPFGSKVPLAFFVQICLDMLDVSFDEAQILANVDRTNELNKGLSPDLTNVIFTHGDLDPWLPVSLTNNLDGNTESIILEGYSLSSDMYSILQGDSAQMTAAKQTIRRKVREWVGAPELK